MRKCITIIRTYRKTSLFFGLLLLAGIVNVLMRFETLIINGTLFCVNAAIISFLWMRKRRKQGA